MTVEHSGEQFGESALRLVITLHRLVRSLRLGTGAPMLNPTQLLVLSHLIDAGPTRIGELAGQAGTSQPTATTVVAGMVAAGLVQRVPDTADGRAVRVDLTEFGRATLLSLAGRQADLVRDRVRGLTVRERAVLAEALPLLEKLSRG
ncbi:MAG TPA: MarR family transcriptional regulator [Pseudonocardiaceae bacterium]|nr:MarR family transcriptional regulator [Pseudonocardiaceae bacterium]